MLVAEKYQYDNNKIHGIPRIEIPKTASDFLPSNGYGLSAIKKYFASIISKHSANAYKEWYLYNYFLGQQEIFKKQRLYLKDSINNNQICENHALRQINFKTGFVTSENREYTVKEDVSSDNQAHKDLSYLNRYYTDVDFFGKDKIVKEWIYTTGVGATCVKPRTDIIVEDQNGYRFATKGDGFDIDFEAPFEFNAVSPIENFVVYSSGMNKEPLFSVSLAEVEIEPNNPNNTATQIEYQIETKYAIFKVNSNLNYKDVKNFTLQTIKTANNIIPIVEHCANNSRLGIIELNKSLFDGINTIVSSIADMVVDNSNLILVFKNVDINSDEVQKMKKAGAIILNDNRNGKNTFPADLSTVTISIDYKGLNTIYEQRITQAYDIAGVPLASGQVTSGGDTGQARMLGGGWSNAITISTNETNTMKIADRQVLKQILATCKLYPDCPINSIMASQIDIKYKLNSSENFMAKAQGIENLYNCHMPKEIILKASGLVNDIGASAKAWEEYDQKVKEEAKVTEQINVTEQNDGGDNQVPATTQSGNGSQE